MEKIRLGVIGAGGIACRRTIPEAVRDLPDVAITSVMDINRAAAQRVAEQFGVPHFCAREEELLARRDVDAVYVATPVNMHSRQTVMAAQAGKHVLCEKPMAGTLEESRAMAEACRKAGVRFMLGFCMRYNVYHRKARELAQAGKFGQFVMGRAQLTCWYPPIPGAWRQNRAVSYGGSFMDLGTHCLDILEFIMGSPVREVFAFHDRLTHAYATDIEDTSTVMVRFENGAHGIVDNYFNLPDAAAQNVLEIHGTRGSLLGRGTIGQEPVGEMSTIFHDQGAYDAQQARSAGPEREVHRLKGPGLYSTMVSRFADAIRGGREPDISMDDAMRSVRTTLAIYQSAATGRPVRVDNVKG